MLTAFGFVEQFFPGLGLYPQYNTPLLQVSGASKQQHESLSSPRPKMTEADAPKRDAVSGANVSYLETLPIPGEGRGNILYLASGAPF